MDWILSLDQKILIFIQDFLRFEWLTPLMKVITSLGNSGIFWIVLGLVLLFTRKYRSAGFEALLALLIGFIIVNLILKNAFHRIRPYEVVEGLKCLVAYPSDWSFPSGHTSSSIAAALAMFRTLPGKFGWPLIVLAILISLSRLYVGVHYPTDVIVGAVVGIFAGWASGKLAGCIRKRGAAKDES